MVAVAEPAVDSKDQEGGEPQTLISHLIELRQRLMRVVIAILVAFAVLTPFAKPLFSTAAAPLIDRLPEGTSMIATDVAAPFLTPFKLTFIVAVLLTIPVTLYQAWAFIAPGLYRNEKRLVMP
ncbi:MAG: twin-arginine translocase subunit TatC, partial [Pseudomonadota bacterium]